METIYIEINEAYKMGHDFCA